MTDDFKIFRIRMKDADCVDHSKSLWGNNQVGIWYGSWEVEELDEAIERYDKGGTAASSEYMNQLAKKWGWDSYKNHHFHTCRRFRDITEKDWIVVYFDGTLYLGQLEGPIVADQKHELSLNGNWFHYRKVINKKKFPLIDLPASYRLLAPAGRANVHEHNSPIRT